MFPPFSNNTAIWLGYCRHPIFRHAHKITSFHILFQICPGFSLHFPNVFSSIFPGCFINCPRISHNFQIFPSLIIFFPEVFHHFFPFLTTSPWLLSRLQFGRWRLRRVRRHRRQHLGDGARGDFAQVLEGLHDATRFLLQKVGDLNLDFLGAGRMNYGIHAILSLDDLWMDLWCLLWVFFHKFAMI